MRILKQYLISPIVNEDRAKVKYTLDVIGKCLLFYMDNYKKVLICVTSGENFKNQAYFNLNPVSRML